MATIGKIAVALGLDSNNFTAGLAKSQRQLSSFGSSVKGKLGDGVKAFAAFDGSLSSLAGKVPALGAGIAVLAGGTGLTAFVQSSAKSIVETGRFAQSLGLSTESVLALRKAAGGAGVDVQLLDQSLGILARNLGMAAGGSDDVLKRFRLIGLSGKDLAALPVDVAFAKIAERIRSLPTPAEQAAAAFQAFGDQGVRLLPLLNKGADGIKAAQEALAKSGGGFSLVDAASVEAASRSVEKLNGSFKVVGSRLAIEIAPALQLAADNTRNWLTGSAGLADNAGRLSTAVQVGVYAAGSIVDALNLAWQTVKFAALGTIETMMMGLVKFYETLGELPSRLGGDRFQRAARNVALFGLEVTKAKEAAQKGAFDALHGGLPTADKWLAQLAAVKRAAAAGVPGPGGAPGAAGVAGLALGDLANKAEQLRQADPLFSFTKGAREFGEMLRAKLIDVDQFGRAMMDLKNKLGATGPVEQFQQRVTDLNRFLSAGAVSPAEYATGIQKARAELGVVSPLEEYHTKLRELNTVYATGAMGSAVYATKLLALKSAFKSADPAASLAASLEGPLDKFRNRLGELNTLAKSGAIGWDLYGKAAGAAGIELMKASEIDIKHPQALTAGSSAAYSTILKAQDQARKDKQDPAEKLRAAVKQQTEIQKRQEALQQQMADALAKLKIKVVTP